MESAVFWPIRPGWHPCDHMLKGPIPPHPPEAMCLFACRAEDWGGAGGRGGGGPGVQSRGVHVRVVHLQVRRGRLRQRWHFCGQRFGS